MKIKHLSSYKYSHISTQVNQYVYNSIYSLNIRFLSRFSNFDLDYQSKLEIIRKYCDFGTFKKLMRNVIDFEAIQSFYFQIREAVNELNPESLEIIHYYDLSLILNSVDRDHIATLNRFYYTYTKTLLYNGFNEDDITSTRYLFAMLYYIKRNDSTILFNTMSDDFYSADNFFEDLLDEIDQESSFFDQHKKALTEEKLNRFLLDKYNLKSIVIYSLENSFIHCNTRGSFAVLHDCIELYLAGEEHLAIKRLAIFLRPYTTQDFYASWTLKDAKRNILAYGYLPKVNNYKNLTLHDFIHANKNLGSFDLRDEIHNHIRLSLKESRKIDIPSISLFWTKYYQRKDYSLININTALHTFERKSYISIIECIELICKIQEISEKGYRGLLLGFVELYEPNDIIPYIFKNTDFKRLNIDWFHLPSKYIDIFPDEIFTIALGEILRYHQFNKVIDLNEIINVLYSNRLSEIEQILKIRKYSIRIPLSHPIMKDLQNNAFNFVEFKPDDYSDDSQSRFERGELTIKDKDFILPNKIKSFEVAGFSNGYHSALAETELFKIFRKEDIRKNFKEILYNALLGKAKSINFYHLVYYFPGNTLKMIYEYEIDEDFEKLFSSFLKFMELSQFPLK